MEITKIIKDQKQTRTTIPAKLVKEAGVETGHVAHWKLRKGKLSAHIMSHEEFVKGVGKDSSLASQSNKNLNCESGEDRAMYDDGIGKSPFDIKKLKTTESMSAGDVLEKEGEQ